MSKEHGKVLVRCPSDWWLLWRRLEVVGTSILKKRGIGEDDIGDILSDWINRLYSNSSYPVVNVYGYAIRALFWTLADWGKSQQKLEQPVDISEVEDYLISDCKAPEDALLLREREQASARILRYLRDYTILSGNLSDAILIDTLWSVLQEDPTLSIFGCCRIAAERLGMHPRSVYSRFLRLCIKLRKQFSKSARLGSVIYDDLVLIDLIDYTAAGMAISQPKAAA